MPLMVDPDNGRLYTQSGDGYVPTLHAVMEGAVMTVAALPYATPTNALAGAAQDLETIALEQWNEQRRLSRE